MPYDYSMLSGKIKEKYGTQAEFAKAIGLSERSVSLKLNGNTDWKQREINTVCKALDIKTADIPLYFFNARVQF